MEALLQYCWRHKLFPLAQLVTVTGEPVEVIDPGLQNTNAGPDFFNAKVKIGGTLWVGNVEVHERSTDWYTHGHDHDAHYDNVILHVATTTDTDIHTSRGNEVPQMRLDVPPSVAANYRHLLTEDRYPPCRQTIPALPKITLHAWMSALQTERLERKTAAVLQRLERCNGSWEAAYFVTLAHNYGFGINGEAFEQWALSIPPHVMDHHRDDLFQIEAIMMGQAGLLSPDTLPRRTREAALSEGYFTRLGDEYQYLRHKFSLRPIDAGAWRFLRLRPQNFPYIRIAQLARLYHEGRAGLSRIIDCETADQLQAALATSVTPYWETHYAFGVTSARSTKRLSPQSLRLLMINTAIPFLFAYGRHQRSEKLCDSAFELLDQLPAEDNHIVRTWREVGLDIANAGDSQALIQLKKAYCDRHDCLRCRIGYEVLKGRGDERMKDEG